jgi:hypothetical protein
MHTLLHKLFAKKGIKDANDLSEEEKATFDQWQEILTKDEMNLGDFKNFCSQQVGIIESKWADYNTTQDRKAELIPYHTVYKTLLSAVDAPKTAREALIKQLTQLTK